MGVTQSPQRVSLARQVLSLGLHVNCSRQGGGVGPPPAHEPPPPPGRRSHHAGLPTASSTCRSARGRPAIPSKEPRRFETSLAHTAPSGPVAAMKAVVVVQNRQLSRSASEWSGNKWAIWRSRCSVGATNSTWLAEAPARSAKYAVYAWSPFVKSNPTHPPPRLLGSLTGFPCSTGPGQPIE